MDAAHDAAAADVPQGRRAEVSVPEQLRGFGVAGLLAMAVIMLTGTIFAACSC